MKKIVLLCALVVFFAFSAFAEDVDANKITGTTDNGLIILKSNDGKFTFELDGRLQLGAALYMGNNNPMGNGTEVRRARLALKQPMETGRPSSMLTSAATRSRSRTSGSDIPGSRTS